MRSILRNIGALLIALVVSFLAADLLQVRLDRWIGAGEEFAVVRFLVGAWAILATAAFGVAVLVARTAAGVNRTAAALVAFVLAAAVAITVTEMMIETRSLMVPREDIVLLAAIAAPLLLVVAIQWGIVRLSWMLSRKSARNANRVKR